MAKTDILIARLRSKPKDFAWSEACTLMKQCGFTLQNRKGSRRMFIHHTGLKVGIHEPHSRPALLPYELDYLIDGLKAVGVIKE